jgi:hypothetical protein
MDLLLVGRYAIIDSLPKRSARKGRMKELPICPKCSGYIPNNDNPGAYSGAISRRDNKTEICSACGVLEAFEDYLHAEEVEEADQVENELWEAILNFANNTDATQSSSLAEDVSTAIINLKNHIHLSTKKGN